MLDHGALPSSAEQPESRKRPAGDQAEQRHRGWAPGHTAFVSLTGHVSDPDSPVRAHFAKHFPHTRELQFADADEPPTVVHTASGDLKLWTVNRFSPHGARALPDDEAGFPWHLAGTAFDYRLRYEFDIAHPNSFAAAKGWDELRRRPLGKRASGKAWDGLVDALSRLVARADPTAGPLPMDEELELARLCGVLGLYEHVFRMGGVANPHTWELPVFQVGLDASVDDLKALVDERLAADVVALVDLFRSSVPQLKHFEKVVPNPEFARSRDLGGADADLVVDDLLVEVKTIKSARIERRFAWQLLAYLLADTDDHCGIRSVAIYFARHGLLWRYTVEEFLHRLAGRDVDLAAARADFADVCAELVRPPLPAASNMVGRSQRVDHPVEREIRFFPPARGDGRWHTPLSQVPWMADAYPRVDPDTPACGAPVTVDVDVAPLIPPVGVERASVDVKLCRRCLLYTESFFANRSGGRPWGPRAGRP